MSDQTDELLSGMLPDFLDEARSLLDQLNEHLLALDSWSKSHASTDDACDVELLNIPFRAAHSIKGLSAMLGLTEINRLTHRLESVLDAGRQRKLPMKPEVIEVIFRGVDQLEQLIGHVADSASPPADCCDTLDAISALLDEAADVEPVASASASPNVASRSDANPRLASTPAHDEQAAQAAAQFASVADEADIPAKYLAIFIDETESSLDSFCETLLASDQCSDSAATEQLMITAHRIKGSAASIGLHRAAKLTHVIEDILQSLRERNALLDADMIDVMLRCGDELRAFVERLRNGDFSIADRFVERYVELQTIHRRLFAPVDVESSTNESAANVLGGAASDLTEDQIAEIRSMAPTHGVGFIGQVRFTPHLPLVGLKARLTTEKLVRLGTLFHCQPAADEMESRDELDAFVFGILTTESATAIESQLSIAGVDGITLKAIGATTESAAARSVEPVSAATTSTSPPPRLSMAPMAAQAATSISPQPIVATSEPSDDAKPAKIDPGAKPAETLRVDIERLDHLMNLAGQLVINKARFVQIGEGMKHLLSNRQTLRQLNGVANLLERVAEASERRTNAVGSLEAIAAQARRAHADMQAALNDVRQIYEVRSSVAHLFEATHQLERVADGIQKSVMDTRMVPIGPLFTRFKRVIRDITRGNGKDVQLVIHGEKTELDKRMIDELGDPLIHMVRNSADHGIELPSEREAAGKPRQGVVTLDAFHRGNSIVIQVADDGRGLDVERIRRKAIEKGLVPAADAERLTSHQVFQLIWEPGFSTAEQVTEISGRGMGMDIVRSKIEQLSGTVDIQSEPGVGTTLSIKLPLTLAILPSLLAEINDDVFAIPIEAVREIVSVSPGDLRSVMGVVTATLRGRVVSVVRFGELFNLDAEPMTLDQDSPTTLVVVQNDGDEIGLVVDRLLGEEDIVIKSLAENYRNIHGISGASILGDGRVSLILDTSAIVDLAAKNVAANRRECASHSY